MAEVKKETYPTPTEIGFYWAKSDTYQWWNLIVEVYGESPFLKIRAWNRGKDVLSIFQSHDIKSWGPKIEIPKA